MAKKRDRKGKRPYRPRPTVAPARPGTPAVPPVSPGSPSIDGEPGGTAAARPCASEDVARLQRRIVGSDAWRENIENQVARLVNAERRKRELPPLTLDERLRRSSRAHCADMAARGFFAHTAPDGRVPADRMRESGHPAPAAENIARGQVDPHAVMRAWMTSPHHRANILLPEIRSIGVGVLHGPGGPWWTQNFGYR